MESGRFLLLAVVAVLANAASAGSTVGSSLGSPVQKVIQLMEECKAKIERDLAAESKNIGVFASFCDDEVGDKTHALEVSNREISDVQASVEDSKASIANYEDEIKELGSLRAAKEKDLHDATELRETQTANFVREERDMVASINELAGAVTMIKKQASLAQVRGAKSLISKKGQIETSVLEKIIHAQVLDLGGRRQLKALVQSQEQASSFQDDDLSFRDQISEGQEPTEGGGALSTMESMQSKAEDNLSDIRKKEMDASRSFDLLKQGLEDESKHIASKIASASSGKASSEEAMGNANGNLVEAMKGKAADGAYLASFKRECQHAAKKWEERQRQAVAELGAIAKAKEILVGGVKVGFVQVQLATKANGDGDAIDDTDATQPKRQLLVQKLRALSKDHKSFALSQLANRAASDAFGKIRGLIENMIDKLVKKAHEDATHEAFCSEEMGKSTKTRDDKSAKSEDYQTKIDSAQSSINQLATAIAELESEIKEIDAATAEATKVRQQEHADFLQSSSDFRESASAVAKAIEVLKDYYAGALLVQVSSSEASSKSITSAQDGSAIVTVLELAEQDFTASLADCEATEDEADTAYKKMLQDNRGSRAAKAAAAKNKQSKVKSVKVVLAHHTEDQTALSEELDSVFAYLDKLKPQCETKVTSYSERKSAREAEIQGLKDAMRILDGDSAAAAFVQVQERWQRT